MLGALQKRLRIAVTIRGHGRNDMARVMRVRVGARPAVHRDEVQHALSSNDAVNLSLTPASRMASGNGLPADIWTGILLCAYCLHAFGFACLPIPSGGGALKYDYWCDAFDEFS